MSSREELKKKWKNRQYSNEYKSFDNRASNPNINQNQQVTMWQQVEAKTAQLNERNRQIEQAQKQQQQVQQTQTTKPSTNVNMLNNLSSAGVGKTNLSQTRMQQTTTKNEEKKQLPTAKQGEKQEVKETSKQEQKQMEKNFRESQQSEYEYNKQKKEEEHKKRLAESDNFAETVAEVARYGTQNLIQKPKALYDGYQFGDVTGIVASTLVGAGTHAIEGVKGVADSAVNTGAYAVSAIADMTGNEKFAKKLRNAIVANKAENDEVLGKINKLFDENSALGASGNQAVESSFQSKVYGILGQAGDKYKKLSDALVFTGGAEGGFQEAYSKENTKGWEALLKGLGSGYASYKAENLFRRDGYGGTDLTDEIKDRILKHIPNGIAKGLTDVGLSAFSEGGEEIVELAMNKKVVNNIINFILQEKKYDTDISVEEGAENYIGAMFSTLIGGGATIANYTSQNNIQNQIQNSNLNEIQKEGLTKIAQENNLSEQDVQNIIEDTLGTENAQVKEKQPTTMENKPISENEQQTTQAEQKKAVNKSSEQIKGNKQKEDNKQEEDAYNWESLMKQAELESGIEQEEEKVETPKQEKIKNETPEQEVVKEAPQETKQVEQKNEVPQNDRKKITEEITKLSFENDLGDENDRVLSRILDGEITLEQGKKELAQKQVEQDRQTLARANKIIDEYDFDEETKQTLRESFIEEFGGKQDRLGSFNQMVENLAKGENVKKTSEKVKLPKQEKKETTKLPEQKQQDRFGFANDKDKGRQKLSATKHREFNETGEYDSAEVLKLDKEIERNRNGKRTIKQWKDMAQELGRRIANKTDEEIEDIAVKSFYDLDILGRDENGKLKNITKYDKTLGKSVSFDRLYASDWVNKVYEGVREGKAGVKPQINNQVIEETKAEQNLPERKREEVSLTRAKQRFKRNMWKYGTTEAIEDAVIHHMLRADELESLQNYAIKQSPNEERQIRNKIEQLKENLEKNNNELKYEERKATYEQLNIEGFNQPSGGSLIDEIWKEFEEREKKAKAELKKNGYKVEIKARKFTKDFVENGYIDLNGKEVNNMEELADIAQIYRNPKYETFRVIYTNGNQIVGQEAVTSRLPR